MALFCSDLSMKLVTSFLITLHLLFRALLVHFWGSLKEYPYLFLQVLSLSFSLFLTTLLRLFKARRVRWGNRKLERSELKCYSFVGLLQTRVYLIFLICTFLKSKSNTANSHSLVYVLMITKVESNFIRRSYIRICPAEPD